MPRIRTHKPEFWSHPVMSRQSDEVKLMALALMNFADDEGYFYADPRVVRAFARPLDENSTITRRAVATLSEIGFLELREDPIRGLIGCIVSFSEHQKIDRPTTSKIKALFVSADSTNARRMLDDGSCAERKGKEGKGTGKGKEKEKLFAESDFQSLSAAAPPPFITLPLNDSSEFPISEEQVLELQNLYPATDAQQEFRAMRGWLLSNPRRRKTKSGIKSFVNSWLKREQDHPKGKANGSGQSRKERELAAAYRAIDQAFTREGSADSDQGNSEALPESDSAPGFSRRHHS